MCVIDDAVLVLDIWKRVWLLLCFVGGQREVATWKVEKKRKKDVEEVKKWRSEEVEVEEVNDFGEAHHRVAGRPTTVVVVWCGPCNRWQSGQLTSGAGRIPVLRRSLSAAAALIH